MIKAITTHKGEILGCGIVGRQAGELIQPWILALTKGMKFGDIAQTIAPYPTLGEVSKRSAGSYFTPSLYSQKIRKIVRFWLSLDSYEKPRNDYSNCFQALKQRGAGLKLVIARGILIPTVASFECSVKNEITFRITLPINGLGLQVP